VVSVPPPDLPVITNPPPARGQDDIPPWVDVPEAEMAAAPADLPPEPAMEPMLPAACLASQHGAEGSDQAPESAAEPRAPGASEFARDQWAGMVRDLIQAERIRALVRELAWNAECLSWDAPPDSSLLCCVLRVEREMLRAPQHIEKLRAALSEHLSLTVELRVEGGPAQDTPSQRYLAEKQKRQEEAEKIIHEDPLVRAMLEQYSTARIVPGSIQPKNRS
jgi:DNA polymerase-3 subunit gamma/tau